MIPKSRTLRCKGYLVWLRSQPCVHCGTEPYPPHSYSDPSHAGMRGTGLKPPDNHASSACHPCHMRHHSKAARHHAQYDNVNRDDYREALCELGLHQWREYLERHPKEKDRYDPED